MELIKIDTDHFVVVNKTIQPVNGYYYDSFINKIKSTNGAEYREASHCWQITHSTQPLELLSENGLSGMGFSKIRPLNVFEVKELIGEVDVEKKAEEYADFSNDYVPLTFGYKFNTNTKRDYLAGYNQALEDNKEKKYTKEDMMKAMLKICEYYADSVDSGGVLDGYKTANQIIQSLQPKTSWQVEIVDGKLKLK